MVTENCSLSPTTLVLQNQVFCSSGANIDQLQRTGTGCQSLVYCCKSADDFSDPTLASYLRVIGSSQTVNADGAVVIPAGRSVQFAFAHETCISNVNFVATRGSVRFTRYYVTTTAADTSQSTQVPVTGDGSTSQTYLLNECRISSLTVTAPATSSITIQLVNFCELDVRCPAAGAAVASAADASSSSSTTAPQAPTSSSSNSAGGATTWVDSTTVAPHAVVPQLNCSYEIPDSDGFCLTVWNYNNYNRNITVYNDDPYTDYFINQPCYTNLIGTFAPGEHTGLIASIWPCQQYEQIHQTWVIDSYVCPTHNGGSCPQTVFRWAQAHRRLNNCPQSLVCEFLDC